MTAAKDRSLAGLTPCGCCEGREVAVPKEIYNRPGLKAVLYRVGTHRQFKESLLARLSSPDFPALQQLTTREDDDFTIALLDAWATLADVLTFYQERIANESFLGTATERLSIRELARLTGYALSPGVAATAYLAFTLEEARAATSAPSSMATSASLAVSTALRQAAAVVPESVTIPAGTRVQSIPGQDEEARIFETVETITGRPKWNKIRPQLTQEQTISGKTSSSLVLQGISLQLKPGDCLLLISGTDKALRQIEGVTEDASARTTSVKLVGHPLAVSESPEWDDGRVDPGDRALKGRGNPGWVGHHDGAPSRGDGFLRTDKSPSPLDGAPSLERPAPGFPHPFGIRSPGATRPSSHSGLQERHESSCKEQSMACALRLKGSRKTLAKAPGVGHTQQVFVMRAKASLFGHNAPAFRLLPEATRILYGADATHTEWPFTSRTSSQLDLDSVYPQIVPGSWAAIAPGGNPDVATFAKVKAVRDTSVSEFGLSSKITRITLDQHVTTADMDSLRGLVVYAQSEQLTLADLPRADDVGESKIELDEKVEGLQPGQALILSGEIDGSSGNYASELITIQSVSLVNGRSVLSLTSGLSNKYKRDTVTLNGNVALATHGETTSEVLGSGDAREVFQSFKLKQKPLTYLTDSTPSGSSSTLKVYVNEVLWTEVENLLESGPGDHHYVVTTDDEGKSSVQFGDGKNGARLSTGSNNVTATYRKGIGLGGRVRKDQLSLLLTRSYGLKEVTNPIGADGGDDPETAVLARSNAPLQVRTLGRVVSLNDYEDFARGFSGIAKALASWTWFGDRKGVFLTVALAQGKQHSSASSGSTVLSSLGEALQKAGPPFVRFQVSLCRTVTFHLSLRVKVFPEYKEDKVKADVEAALRDAFSFDSRSFAQGVHLSEIMSVVQGVSGVEGVDVDRLYRSGREAKLNDRLAAAGPEASPGGSPVGAELLTLDPGPLDQLGVMP